MTYPAIPYKAGRESLLERETFAMTKPAWKNVDLRTGEHYDGRNVLGGIKTGLWKRGDGAESAWKRTAGRKRNGKIYSRKRCEITWPRMLRMEKKNLQIWSNGCEMRRFMVAT